MYVAEIMYGSVLFDSNYELCYMNTITWSNMQKGPNTTTSFKSSDQQQPARECKYVLLSSIFLSYNTTNLFLIFTIYSIWSGTGIFFCQNVLASF